MIRTQRYMPLIVVGLLASACSDPSDPADNEPRIGRTSIVLESETGDYIGVGKSYQYDLSNAVIVAQANASTFSISINGDEVWSGLISTKATDRLEVGEFTFTEFPVTSFGAAWSGEGRGCGTYSGTSSVDSLEYRSDRLTSIHLRFELHCESKVPALRGNVRWSAADTTRPRGPVLPVPASLWTPPASALPATGNYVYLEGDAGEYIGQGETILYTGAAAVSVTSQTPLRLVIDQGRWDGVFATMYTLSRQEAGYYPNLRNHPFHNTARGGLSWSGAGRSCNNATGWYAIDSITYDGPVLAALQLRFEQLCEGKPAPLRGAIRWSR